MKKLLLALLAVASFAAVSEVSAGNCNTCPKKRCEKKRCEKPCKEEAPLCEYTVCKKTPAKRVCKTTCHYVCPPDCVPSAKTAHMIGEANERVVARSGDAEATRPVRANRVVKNGQAASDVAY